MACDITGGPETASPDTPAAITFRKRKEARFTILDYFLSYDVVRDMVGFKASSWQFSIVDQSLPQDEDKNLSSVHVSHFGDLKPWARQQSAEVLGDARVAAGLRSLKVKPVRRRILRKRKFVDAFGPSGLLRAAVARCNKRGEQASGGHHLDAGAVAHLLAELDLAEDAGEDAVDADEATDEAMIGEEAKAAAPAPAADKTFERVLALDGSGAVLGPCPFCPWKGTP